MAVDERVGDAPREGHCVEDGDVVVAEGPPAAGDEAEEEHERLEDAVGGKGGDPGTVGGGGTRAQVRGQPAADEAAEAEDGDDEGQMRDTENLRDRALQ